MKKLILILVAAAATLFSAALRADDYPSRPITIVAVFGPGSASDTICRIIADKLSPLLGQSVIVEDRPGADGALAALYVHHQPADGYTLLMGTNSPLSADPFIHRDLGYDPIKDFVPITRVGSFTLMLVVDPNLPIHSIKELVDYAKVNPGKLSFASGNTAGIVGGYTLSKMGRDQHAPCTLQNHGTSAYGHHRGPRIDDVCRFHLRSAACQRRDRAPFGNIAHTPQLALS